MYIERDLEKKLHSFLKQFKVVLVTGPRQVGKTTLLHHALSDYRYLTLDDLNAYNLASTDPGAFLNRDVLPVVVDEIQQTPDLFRQVKYLVDSIEDYGLIVLTGSQTYQLMQGVSESLAGRIGILELPTLSLREILKNTNKGPYIPSLINDEEVSSLSRRDLWATIQRGTMPRLQDQSVDWYDYYSSYTRTYLERDVRQLINIKNERKFYKFMIACAARTGQLLNATDIANTVDVDVKTIQGWLSVLQASGIIHLLQPFWANTTKRLTKTPKLYFMDTGLACYLTSWNTPEQLMNGAVSGHMFETFVVSEVLKSFMNTGRDVRNVYFYRDARKKEIDLIIQDGCILHPVEIKQNVTVDKSAIKNFECINDIPGYEIGFGHVICQTDKAYLVTKDVQAIPVCAI